MDPDDPAVEDPGTLLRLFAAQMSHELRTPLTAVLANAEMLASEPAVATDPDLRSMVEGVARAAHRMNSMLEQMMGYARGGGEPRRAPVDLTRVFRRALDRLEPVVAERQAAVAIGDLPTLPADADQMEAVASHLLDNALKFSRPDVTPRVVVSAEDLGARWRVRVSDNGVGVPPERREAMFLLFARGDKRVEGEGIGLAVTEQLVRAHGGRVGMEGVPGVGTTVWLELPA